MNNTIDLFCDKCGSQLTKVKEGTKVIGFQCMSCYREWHIVCTYSGKKVE
jgi:DNA-directed RNA polymerase subunit M/transcription elongation factor TFIIS